MNALMFLFMLIFCVLYLEKTRSWNNYFTVFVISIAVIVAHGFFSSWGVIWTDAVIYALIAFILSERWGEHPHKSLIFRLVHKNQVDKILLHGSKEEIKMEKTAKIIKSLRRVFSFVVCAGIAIWSVLFIKNEEDWFIVVIPGIAAIIHCFWLCKIYLDAL